MCEISLIGLDAADKKKDLYATQTEREKCHSLKTSPRL